EMTQQSLAEPVNIVMKGRTLEEVLDALFGLRNMKWSIRGNIIRIREASHITGEMEDPVFSDAGIPPPITVRGRIVNEAGEPVIASVMIKGTRLGTTSDADGLFRLENVDENAI